MEIEAKFTLSNRETFERLRALDRLCGYELSAPTVHEVHDTYFDTAERRVLAAGYTFRQRTSPHRVTITLKALTPSAQTVHRREECELTLTGDASVDDLPMGPLRERLQHLTRDSALTALVELHQKRHVRSLMQAERKVAELSLDEIVFILGNRRQAALELEIELGEQGKEEDLVNLTSCLQHEWGLEPQPQSKFERALALTERFKTCGMLRQSERDLLVRFATVQGRCARRARALLALDEGKPVREAAKIAPLSPKRVRYWLNQFRKQRLQIFRPHVPVSATPHAGVSSALEGDPQLTEAAMVEPMPNDTERRLPVRPGLEPDDPMAEAARKTLSFHLQQMLYYEPGTRKGEDPEHLHDMRVATRRMRAALRIFEGYLDLKDIAPFVKGLRRTGRMLGTVRDLDVFGEKTEAYLGTLSPEQRTALDPLLAVWNRRREVARQEMLAYLDSQRYRQFKEGFGQFLQKPEAGALPAFTKTGQPRPHRLRHVVPLIIHERFAAVRAYGEWVEIPDAPLDQYHRLRIAAKELRYALEFFREVLGPETKTLIGTMKDLQDHLGCLQDAVVACNLLRDFLTWGTWGQPTDHSQPWPGTPVLAPGVATYLAVRQTEIQNLVKAFPEVWARVQSQDLAYTVELALRPLW